MIKALPDIDALRKEAERLLTDQLSRAGEVLPNQWVGQESGFPSDPSYHLALKFRITKGGGRGKEWWLHAAIKREIYPKQARLAIWELKRRPEEIDGIPVYPILIAPRISPAVAKLCLEEDVGYLDLSGNCELFFGGIWIKLKGLEPKYKVDDSLKSLFSPKASRLLRVLLQGPLRPWKVEDLAASASVSLGLVSKVRKALLEQELAEDGKNGIQIARPDELLADWLSADAFSKRASVREYSTLSTGNDLAEKLAAYLNSVGKKPLFTLNYAAWLRAPHNVPTVVSAYVGDFPDDEELLAQLGARSVQRGSGNLRLLKHADHFALGIDQQSVKQRPDLALVSDIQLYLDLPQAEPNGAEQAGVLRKLKNFGGGWS